MQGEAFELYPLFLSKILASRQTAPSVLTSADFPAADSVVFDILDSASGSACLYLQWVRRLSLRVYVA